MSSLPSINKTLVIVVTKNAKIDIKLFLSYPVLLDFCILLQIFCPALWFLKSLKSANTWQISNTFLPHPFQHHLPNTPSCVNVINVWSLIYLWNLRLFDSKLTVIHVRKSEGKTMATNIQGWKVSKLPVGVKNDLIEQGGLKCNTVKYKCPVLFNLPPLLNL